MIVQEKVKRFASCNGCGRYNMQMQPTPGASYKVTECGDIHKYILGGSIEVRLCSSCAYELKELLKKQLGGSND